MALAWKRISEVHCRKQPEYLAKSLCCRTDTKPAADRSIRCLCGMM